METIVEFTEHDQHMVKVLDDLRNLQDGLADHARWLDAEWGRVSDDPMPFFEIWERPGTAPDSVEFSLVFVLRRIEADESEITSCAHQ